MPVTISGGTLSGGTTKNDAAQTGGVDYAAGGDYLGEFGGAGAPVGYQGTGYGTLIDDSYQAPSSSEGVANMIEAQTRQALINKQIEARDRALYGGDPVTRGFGTGQTAIKQLYNRIYNQPLPDIGMAGISLNALGSRTARGILDRVAAGGKPVYDPTGQIVGVMSPSKMGNKIGGFLEDTFGFDLPDSESYFGRAGFDPNRGGSSYDPDTQVYRAQSVSGDIPMGDDDGFVAPEATAVAAAQPEADPRQSMIDQGYRYPAGGIYPTEGQYMRQGLLDLAPQVYGGLLAGYDQPQFAEMNVGFRQPTDVSIYDDPYDVTGYSLI
jgi:hypothetical protein